MMKLESGSQRTETRSFCLCLCREREDVTSADIIAVRIIPTFGMKFSANQVIKWRAVFGEQDTWHWNMIDHLIKSWLPSYLLAGRAPGSCPLSSICGLQHAEDCSHCSAALRVNTDQWRRGQERGRRLRRLRRLRSNQITRRDPSPCLGTSGQTGSVASGEIRKINCCLGRVRWLRIMLSQCYNITTWDVQYTNPSWDDITGPQRERSKF